MKYSFDEHDGKVTLPLSPPGETPRAEHWRSMLTKVGGWDNELAAVPAGGVRKLIEEFGNLERDLQQSQTMLQGSERINAELREELRRAQERCEELEEVLATARIHIANRGAFRSHADMLYAIDVTLNGAAASGPKEGG